MKKKVIIGLLILILSIGVLVLLAFLFRDNNLEPVEKYLDDIVPTIKLKQEMVYIDADTEYNLEDNIEATFGKDGGEIVCSDNKLVIGNNTVTCVAKGKNKTSSEEVSYSIKKSTTYQKNVIYFGDSITSGWLGSPKGYSWVNYIQNNYDLNTSVNAGIADYRVSTYDDRNKWLVTQVRNHYNDQTQYNFIIMQGGINDMLYGTPIGTMSDSFDVNSFNQNTFIGGLETYISSVVTKWPNARIGYIITYFCPNYTERGLKWDYNAHKVYYDATIKVLDKWGIKYLDLFAGSTEKETYTDFFKVYTREYLPDYLHLNNAGYNKVSPYIYNFMQTLENI